MNTMNLADRAPARITLKLLLTLDALTCLVTGALLALSSVALAESLGLPQQLLFYAGLVLFPCAALMGLAARTRASALAWMVILGNFAWAIASVGVVFALEPTSFGVAFVIAQAGVVALLGVLEWRAWLQPTS